MTLLFALTYLRYTFKIDQFDKEKFQSFTESIVYSVLWNLYVTLIVYIISLHQGYIVPTWVKLVATLCIILYLFYTMLNHFIRDRIDFTLFEQNAVTVYQISLRTVVIAQSFDLITWLCYQFFKIYTKPNVVYLRSKIRVKLLK